MKWALRIKKLFEGIKYWHQSQSGEALLYILITVAGSLMPVWGGLLLYKLFAYTPEYWIFVDQGQFYIYSAAFFTPSCYLLFRNKNSRNIWHSILFLLSVFLLVISAILFSGMSFSKISPSLFVLAEGHTHVLDFEFLRISSLILFVFSVFVAFAAQAIENKLRSGGPTNNTVSEDREQGLNDLEAEFDRIQSERENE